ncbi:hypothetical protein GUJ93_ZPchr0012g20460 [Zizania palustris]|uniref:Uncharacterized protein n=1 Tax=Zizania palustris TaxID=103762 RepID=A0A8J5WTL5_ZIZPA|nr:hypothetical protein GUJ93_ZPchr0012g20460 [Zizania palustris]
MLLFSPIRSLPSLSPSAFSSLSASLAVLSPRWPSSASAHTAHLSAPSSRHAWHECAAVASPNQFSTSSGTATPPPNGHNSNPGAFSPPSVRSHDVARPPPSPRCVTLYRCPLLAPLPAASPPLHRAPSPLLLFPLQPRPDHKSPCAASLRRLATGPRARIIPALVRSSSLTEHQALSLGNKICSPTFVTSHIFSDVRIPLSSQSN